MERSGLPGRPKFEISEDVLLELRSCVFTWKQIADMLLVSEPIVNKAFDLRSIQLFWVAWQLSNRHMIVRIGWVPAGHLVILKPRPAADVCPQRTF